MTPSIRRSVLALCLLACSLAVGGAHADSPAATTAAPAAASRPAPKPLLWKVSDQDNSIYLLGSFHLLKADDYPLSSDIEQAFAEADKLVFEVPPAELSDPALGLKMAQLAGYSDGRTLSQVVPVDVLAKMKQVLGAEHVSQLEAMEPWFINLGLLIGVSQKLGFQPDQGLDLHLARRAEAASKPVAGLETADQQLAVLDSTPMDEQVAGLRDFLADPAEAQKLLTETHEAWRNGDAKRLGELAIDQFRTDTPVTYRIINVQRNDAWVPQLQQMLDGAKEGNTLVVVGAMHLLGPDGVVEKLRAKGYRVERICSACSGQK